MERARTAPRPPRWWGRFRKHGTKARGILRVHGAFPPLDASGCDTGKGDWSAHRVPSDRLRQPGP